MNSQPRLNLIYANMRALCEAPQMMMRYANIPYSYNMVWDFYKKPWKEIKNSIYFNKIPILIMHGKIDKIVPFRMGKELYELANAPKYSYFSKYDDHMMNYDKNLLKSLKDYIYSLN